MTKRNRLLVVTLTGAFAVTMLLSSAAGAAECLAKPNEAEGGRWHYRTNRATNQKCWYRHAPEVETTGAPTTLHKPQPPAETAAKVDTSAMTASQLKDLYEQFLQWRTKREMR